MKKNKWGNREEQKRLCLYFIIEDENLLSMYGNPLFLEMLPSKNKNLVKFFSMRVKMENSKELKFKLM